MTDRQEPTLARRVRSGGAFVLHLAVAGALLAAGTMAIHAAAQGPIDGALEEAPATPVRAIPVALQDRFTVERLYAGRVEAPRSTDLGFEEGGTLAALLVQEGDIVAAGQVMARTDRRALDAALAEAEAQRDALVAQRDLAILTLDRTAELEERGFASNQAGDEARLTVRRLEAEIARADAAIDAIAIRLEKTEIRAPFDAVVAARMVDEGRILAAGEPVVRLLERGGADVRIGLPAAEARALAVGQAHAIRVDGEDHTGVVTAIRADVDQATRTVPVLFSIGGDLPALGQTAELRLSSTIAEPGFWLPNSALREGVRGLWTVFVIVEGETVPEAVEIVHFEGDRSYLRGALPDGALVVADGIHRVTAGERVRIAE